MFEIADGRKFFYQWDIDVKLLLKAPEGQTVDEVHFTDGYMYSPLQREVVHTETESYVVVPNVLLQHPWAITAYAYYSKSDGSRTMCERQFDVKPRPKPDAYVYSEEELAIYNKKLDKPAIEGEKDQVLTSNGDGTAEWRSPQAGVPSWNDLTDRPFGEIVRNVLYHEDASEAGVVVQIPGITGASAANKQRNLTITISSVHSGDVLWEKTLGLSTYTTEDAAGYYVYIFGNIELVNNDANVSRYKSYTEEDEERATYPICVYSFVDENEGLNYWAYYLDESKLTVTDFVGVYTVKIEDADETETIIVPLEEQYIPDSAKLPEVTEEDNWKSMKVINGEWKLAGDAVLTELMGEQDLSFALNSSYGLYYWGSDAMFELVSGKNYRVVWDGTEYTCVAEEMTMGAIAGIGLGNKSIVGIGDDTEEPFIFAYLEGEYQNAAFSTDTAEATHVVSVGLVEKDPYSLPAVTEEDNGKFLQVVKGKWQAVTVANGNEVEY